MFLILNLKIHLIQLIMQEIDSKIKIHVGFEFITSGLWVYHKNIMLQRQLEKKQYGSFQVGFSDRSLVLAKLSYSKNLLQDRKART